MVASASNEKYYGLDALRGALAIIVCIAHGYQVFLAPLDPERSAIFAGLGIGARLAVLWFFCLSGYVIALSVDKNLARNGYFCWREYASSRLWRILPPLLFVITLGAILALTARFAGIEALPVGVEGARASYGVNFKTQLLSLVTVGAKGDLSGGLNGPLWSLQFELQFYFFVGLAAFSVLSRSAWWARGATAVAFAVYWDCAFALRSLSGALAANILWYGAFGSGYAAYHLARRRKASHLVLAAIMALIAAAWAFLSYGGPDFINEANTSATLMLCQMTIALCCAALIVLVSRWKASASVGECGKFGYTLYVIHFPIHLFLYFALVNGLIYSRSMAYMACVFSVVGTVLIASFFSRWLESPRRLKNLLKLLGRRGLESRPTS
jgi:peptidoglycan/LPS O-acetylase OafA/YrhL